MRSIWYFWRMTWCVLCTLHQGQPIMNTSLACYLGCAPWWDREQHSPRMGCPLSTQVWQHDFQNNLSASVAFPVKWTAELSLRSHPDAILHELEPMFTFKNQSYKFLGHIVGHRKINLQSLCKGPLNRFKNEELPGGGGEWGGWFGGG